MDVVYYDESEGFVYGVRQDPENQMRVGKYHLDCKFFIIDKKREKLRMFDNISEAKKTLDNEDFSNLNNYFTNNCG